MFLVAEAEVDFPMRDWLDMLAGRKEWFVVIVFLRKVPDGPDQSKMYANMISSPPRARRDH